MPRKTYYKVKQMRGGLGFSYPAIQKTLTEAELKELGFWSEKLAKTGRDYFEGSNKVTYVTRVAPTGDGRWAITAEEPWDKVIGR